MFVSLRITCSARRTHAAVTSLGYFARHSGSSGPRRAGCETALSCALWGDHAYCDRYVGKPLAPRCHYTEKRKERHGKDDLDRADRRRGTQVRHLLGAAMKPKKRTKSEGPSLLDVVALLADIPSEGLARGQVGTVVEQLDDEALLVEFSDEQGRAYAVVPCPRTELLVLHYVPVAA
jgi:hypothetical protein